MFRSIASCVGLVFFFIGSSHAYFDTSDGAGSGVNCSGHICAEYASCSVNNTCVCDHAIYNSGNGYLKCSPADYANGHMINDPILSTFENEHANLALPCRYDFTKINTQLIGDDGQVVGTCGVYVAGFNRKDKGKFYVHGIDTAIRVTFFNGTTFFMSVRKFGVAENGTYYYQINATEGIFDLDGPFNDDDIFYHDPSTGLTIVECYIDKENNVAIINITHCGVCIYFRPYDVILRRQQVQIPGFAVGINLAYGPFWYRDGGNGDLALAPKPQHNAFSMADLVPEGASNTVKIIYRALKANIPQINPYPNLECVDARTAILGLDVANITSAFSSCLWMLQSPKFIRCFDTTETGVNIMELFAFCIQITTGDKRCSDVQLLITKSACESHDPTNTNLQNFMSGSLC